VLTILLRFFRKVSCERQKQRSNNVVGYLNIVPYEGVSLDRESESASLTNMDICAKHTTYTWEIALQNNM